MWHGSAGRRLATRCAQMRTPCEVKLSERQAVCALQVLVNDTKQRTFLVVAPESEPEQWVHLIASVDTVMKRHHLKPFYQPAQVHVSLCWWAGDASAGVIAHMAELQGAWNRAVGVWSVSCGAAVLMFGHERHVLRRC